MLLWAQQGSGDVKLQSRTPIYFLVTRIMEPPKCFELVAYSYTQDVQETCVFHPVAMRTRQVVGIANKLRSEMALNQVSSAVPLVIF